MELESLTDNTLFDLRDKLTNTITTLALAGRDYSTELGQLEEIEAEITNRDENFCCEQCQWADEMERKG